MGEHPEFSATTCLDAAVRVIGVRTNFQYSAIIRSLVGDPDGSFYREYKNQSKDVTDMSRSDSKRGFVRKGG